MKAKILSLTILLAFCVLNVQSLEAKGNVLNVHSSSEWRYYESSLQYVPCVMYMGMEYLGVQSREDIIDRSISLAATSLIMVATVNLTFKNLIREERPDGSSFNSFPSGHTALAFAGADMVRRAYGWEWGAACYAMATAVGIGRVVHQRHWWWDCVAGAAVGIGCSYLGSLCVRPVRNLFGINNNNISIVPDIEPYTGALCARISYSF